jgi:hypothetical protein
MRLLYSLSAAVLLAVLVLAACNSTENKGNKAGDSSNNSNNSAARVPTPPSGHVAPSDGVKRVTTIETRDAVEKGEAIIVDVRGDAAYKQSHIKGSISVPGDQVEARLAQLPRDKMIVTYCS